MPSPELSIISFDVRVLILSVLASTVISFLVATLLALKLWRQPLGLRGTALYALASTGAFVVVLLALTHLVPAEHPATLIGMLLGLLATQWLLARSLLPRLQQRRMIGLPATVPAAWRVALVTAPACALMLTILGFAQLAFFFSPS